MLSGCLVTRASASSVAIASGTYSKATNTTETYAGATKSGIAAAATGKHRYDLVYLDTADGTVKVAAGVEDTPTAAGNFLENAAPLPPDLPSETTILLAVLCIDDTGIIDRTNGNYSTGGVADMRFRSSLGAHLISYLSTPSQAQGDIIQRGSANWERLAVGLAGKYLRSQGASNNLIWDYLNISSLYDGSQVRGDVVMRGASAWGRLAAGSQYKYLMSNGVGADLTYEYLLIGSLYHASEARGCLATRGATTWGMLAPGLAGKVLTAQGTGADLTWEYPGYHIVEFAAGSMFVPSTNGATFATDVGTNGDLQVNQFDDTTEEFLEAVFRVPSNVLTTGTVTFEAVGYSATAASAKYVQLKVYHSAKTENESWDAAYATKLSGDLGLSATQDQLDFHSWTETISNLGWAANDQVRVKISRVAPSGTDLTGDYNLTLFRIKIPRSSL